VWLAVIRQKRVNGPGAILDLTLAARTIEGNPMGDCIMDYLMCHGAPTCYFLNIKMGLYRVRAC
jgi:hypothetical protein